MLRHILQQSSQSIYRQLHQHIPLHASSIPKTCTFPSIHHPIHPLHHAAKTPLVSTRRGFRTFAYTFPTQQTVHPRPPTHHTTSFQPITDIPSRRQIGTKARIRLDKETIQAVDERQDAFIDEIISKIEPQESYTYLSDLQMHPFRYRSWNLLLRPEHRPVAISNNDYTPTPPKSSTIPIIESPYQKINSEELVDEILSTRNPFHQLSLMYTYSPNFFMAFLGLSVVTAIYFEDYTDGLIFGIDVDKFLHSWITPILKKYDDPEMVKQVEEDIRLYREASSGRVHHYDASIDEDELMLEDLEAQDKLPNHQKQSKNRIFF